MPTDSQREFAEVTKDFDDQLRALDENATKLRDEMKTLLTGAKDAEGNVRNLDETESARFEEIDKTLDGFDVRRKELETARQRELDAAIANKRYGLQGGYVVSESGPYTRVSSMNGGPSYIRDLWRAKQKGDVVAMERLRQNDKHVNAYAERTGLTTVNGAGGEFVPPLWLEEDYVPFMRASRKTANLCVNAPLPGGTDSINIPKISGGTAVAFQGTQNAGPLQETDLTTTSVSSGVYTAAGGQTIAVQLVEQSPVNIDQIVMTDLMKAMAQFVDSSVVLNGSGTNQPTGILTLAGTNAITFTSASPTVALFYSKLANAIQTIETARFDVPTHIVMHPRRWAWLLAASDTTSRPLIVPNGPAFNPVAEGNGVSAAEGVVGTLQGLPVVTDANVPTNTGAGTNQDPVIVAKYDDLYLWEGRLNADIFPQTYAYNASLYARLYEYVSFQAARYPTSISIINGTGMVAPTF